MDGCRPCGETTIKLFRGSDLNNIQSISSSLEIFLKGSKMAKIMLYSREPQLCAQFEKIWGIRNRHLVQGLPLPYIFFLNCCFQSDCPHPICIKGGSSCDYTWYPGGPSISTIPLDLVDPERPWGSTTCSDDKGFCTGHYKPIMVNVDDKEALTAVAMPPSHSLKQIFNNRASNGNNFSEEATAKENLLTIEEVNIWFDHLNTVLCNRKRGAAKAALTRQKNKMKSKNNKAQSSNLSHDDQSPKSSQESMMPNAAPAVQQSLAADKVQVGVSNIPTKVITTDDDVYYCAGCGLEYHSESNALFWIACDACDRWYCSSCEGLLNEPDVTIYVCKNCL